MSRTQKQYVLIVDDTPANIAMLGEILSADYNVLVATDGKTALEIASRAPYPDLILLDIMMPEMDGYEVCQRLKQSVITRKIPVIFVTAMTDNDNETKGFEAGAVDYIIKPIRPAIVRARVKNHLALYDQNQILEQKVEERTREITMTQDTTIHSMAVLAEIRDNETGSHIMRTQHFVRLLAEHLMGLEKFRDVLDPATVELIFKSTPLHDIGKVGVPDAILHKLGKLTTEEFEIMKNHPKLGRDALCAADQKFGVDSSTSFLRIAKEVAYSHHEKWDGSGYPDGLVGEDIPLAGRLMALADVYDALTTKRVYKPAFSHEKAMAIITPDRGSHFDPDIVDAFIILEKKFSDIAKEFSDYEKGHHIADVCSLFSHCG
ncbi:MAG: two-component system response regulator [Deltaproteobacteria bacterium]|nr:two-component system response regulator [Deltaproteobacteria bacterium]